MLFQGSAAHRRPAGCSPCREKETPKLEQAAAIHALDQDHEKETAAARRGCYVEELGAKCRRGALLPSAGSLRGGRGDVAAAECLDAASVRASPLPTTHRREEGPGRPESSSGALGVREPPSRAVSEEAAPTGGAGRRAQRLDSRCGGSGAALVLALVVAALLPGLSQGAVTSLTVTTQPDTAVERQVLMKQPKLQLQDGSALATEDVAVTVECAQVRAHRPRSPVHRSNLAFLKRHILHPEPYKFYTPNLTLLHSKLHPSGPGKLQILHFKPWTLNSKPQPLNPKPKTHGDMRCAAPALLVPSNEHGVMGRLPWLPPGWGFHFRRLRNMCTERASETPRLRLGPGPEGCGHGTVRGAFTGVPRS